MTAREALFYLTSGRSNDPRRADAAAVLNGLVVRDEHRTPQERRDDYEAVADAVRRDGGGAILELASLAVCAGVPLVSEL